MAGGIFDPELHQLPMRIPIFPLPSALLLPGGQLPLNIFEPRYLAMVMHALATPTRLIGMVQPLDHHAGGDRADGDTANDDGICKMKPSVCPMSPNYQKRSNHTHSKWYLLVEKFPHETH